MKLLKSIAVGAIALAFTACSSEEPKNTTGSEDGNSFMSISLGMTNAGTKAITDGGYEYGSEAESSVKLANSIFLFYDAAGNFLTSGTLIDEGSTGFLTLSETTTAGASVERKSNATIILGPTKVKPTQVLAVLNYDDVNSLKNKTLAEVLAVVENKAVSTTPAKGDLILTNSSYSDDSKVVTATQVTAANICETREAALANPVDIYVERTVAKLNMTPAAGVTTITEGNKTKYVFNVTTEDIYVNNAKVQARIVIDGWHENAINESGYLIKNVDNAWLTTAPFTGWNSAAEFRSFWAKDENYTAGADDDYDFNIAVKSDQKGTYKNLEYYSWNEAAAAFNSCYLHENTVPKASQKGLAEQKANVTTMLISAHLEISEDGGATWTEQNLFRKDGVFYTEDAFKTRIVNALNGKLRWYTADKTVNVAPEDLTFAYTTTHNNKSVVSVSATGATAPASMTGAVLQKNDNGVWSTVEATAYAAVVTQYIRSEAAALVSDVTGWKGGACYYQVPIEHLSSTSENPFWGVVRNHIYQLTLSSVTRIGAAVWDKDEELVIIPGKEHNYYVAARLNVLSWKSIKQDVVLD